MTQARRFTTNLSAPAGLLLADFVARQGGAQSEKQRSRNEVCEALNRFGEAHGSIADEHSTL